MYCIDVEENRWFGWNNDLSARPTESLVSSGAYAVDNLTHALGAVANTTAGISTSEVNELT